MEVAVDIAFRVGAFLVIVLGCVLFYILFQNEKK